MSNIARRLRAHVENRGGAALRNGAWEMMLEAADDIEKSTALLIKLAWNNANLKDYQEARKLVIRMLDLDDSRPVDTQKRKDALNAFLAEREAERVMKQIDAVERATPVQS